MKIENEQDQRLTLEADAQVQNIKIQDIKANPYQPRKTFDEERLKDLAESIKLHGILQPIVLRKTIAGYNIVVGERRFRAAGIAGLREVPAIIKSLTDEDMMELAIIENLQREDLNAIEEAESYRKLMDDLNLTQQAVAQRLSKSRPYIANMLRLLHLPKSVSNMVKNGSLSGAHGRTLLIVKDTQKMQRIANKAYQESWSVRELEQYVTTHFSDKKEQATESSKATKPKFIRQQERQLKEQYGSNVAISTNKTKGQITFEFKSEAEFKRLIHQLNDKYNND
ncbi:MULTISPECIES: ParB/RepB/Spo0J family partition protein [Staphylococcus]|uniref:ParB/RepB/Spo0J family partition protein n=1 Tax=Staphylococcus xylosus TaxID=1288 RepID=A0A418IP75_STAXY|nr:ParB/RepB/Spo0J family partition protein [Staphylococcus xylosus]MRF38210.1 ParB/RepB/Spo0J family partition protein [Staphylococcus sp. KY49P]TFV23619.1 ParB/RepB/Spo0J family partition protein [Staphylococcus saprophyticus]NQD98445.1 ParB/RepB/Spo0J family partition protein [Staphylococcus xylosus]PTI10484.1 ParB/RepB/Spo0J family partition protein [Staphylococcus xylosus]RIN11148.1 ParB/RepB/Spo0J family partition protein [Staphylococcus xylosus]